MAGELLRRPASRRQFLGGLAALVGAGATGLGLSSCERQLLERETLAGSGAPPSEPPLAEPEPLPPASVTSEPRHLSWVWQFSQDGSPASIRRVLAEHNLGVTLKTHDGTDWMAEYDTSPYAVSGPRQVEALAESFEEAGVPFHAWCVVKGSEPEREARMCADVLSAGARSLYIDLEPHSGFWEGRPRDALAFGRELRRRQPDARLVTSLDHRPWEVPEVPLEEFASFSDAFAPLIYWETFNSSANVRRFEESGFSIGPEGITPEFLLDVSFGLLHGYQRPIEPVGQGASRDGDAWERFLAHASVLGMERVSVWRHGVTDNDVWRLLREVELGSDGRTEPLAPGATVIVSNTGSCLRVREAPGTSASIIICLPDGVTATVRDGPEEADGFRWWLIESGTIEGWAAEGESGGDQWLVPLS